MAAGSNSPKSLLSTSVDGGLRTIRIEPGKVNALDLELVRALADEFKESDDVRAIVLTGTERIFSAGVDLQRLLASDLEYTRVFLHELDALVQVIFGFPRPVVAALTGHAIAGGCLIAAACDYRVMGQGRIGVTESLVGLPVPPACMEALRFVTGRRTNYLVLTGTTLELDEALEIGLIDEQAEPSEVLQRAIEVAGQFAATPANTFRLHKKMLRVQALEQMKLAVATQAQETADLWTDPETRGFAATYLEGLKK